MRTQEPKALWENFYSLTQIPRPSGKKEAIGQFLANYGRSLGLETIVDEIGNVIIRKPASPGYENHPGVILQGHMDMVPQKNGDKVFDFEKDPICAYVEDNKEWVTADGTTLGADNGIGVATAMTILADKSVVHPPLEAFFTVDEETGMYGAQALQGGVLKGSTLLNLDSETEGELYIGCAGGVDTTARFDFEPVATEEGDIALKVCIKGLKGGHSGDDIEKKRANAIKILARFLYMEQSKTDLRLAQWNSGKMHNAIPRDGKIVFAVPADKKEEVKADWNIFSKDVEDEFHVTDVNMVWNLQSTDAQKVLPKEVSRKLIAGLQALDNGVFAICQDPALNDMVETSSNVASVKTTDDSIVFVASHRSNVTSNLRNMANTVRATFELAGAEVEQGSGYPAWKMNPNSKMVKVAVDAYKKLFHKDPVVRGIHAGLECGLFSEKYPELDMVSFGPTLRHVHTPDECLHIPTVQMVWDHLLEILKNIPEE